MWGSFVSHASTLQAVSPSPFDPQGETRQISRVSYKRPDTWTFLFGLVVTEAPDSVLAVNVTLRVDIELTVGVGRGSISLRQGVGTGQGFARMQLAYTTPLTQRTPFGTWTTVARTPPVFPGAATADITEFPAEDIQCSARIFGTSGVQLLGQPFRVDVHAYFAPRTHVRPDWFGDDNLFRGNESGGT
jgi:hypothetical protein